MKWKAEVIFLYLLCIFLCWTNGRSNHQVHRDVHLSRSRFSFWYIFLHVHISINGVSVSYLYVFIYVQGREGTLFLFYRYISQSPIFNRQTYMNVHDRRRSDLFPVQIFVHDRSIVRGTPRRERTPAARASFVCTFT